MLLAAVCLGVLSSGVKPAEDPHYVFTGPISKFAIEGSTPGLPTSGLGFSVVVSDGGKTVAPTDFDLKSPDWNSPIHVHLTNPSIQGGRLKATLEMENSSGLVLEGIRFDCDGAIESFDSKDENNKPIVKTRTQPVSIASPILLGDLPSNDHADSQSIDIGDLIFAPETRQISVNLRLSGLTYLRSVKTHEGCGAGRLSLDTKGRIYMSDREGMWRCNPDGSDGSLITKYGDYTSEVVVDPKTGEIVGGPGNGVRFTRRSVAGDDLGLIPVNEDFDHTPFYPCFAPNGDLYVRLDSVIVMYRGGKELRRAEKIGTVGLGMEGLFDVDAKGSILLPAEGSLVLISPDWKTTKRISTGPDWHLGRFMKIDAVRRDSVGNMYVAEKAWDEQQFAPRISVFDANGHFVRVFGRGDRAPASNVAEQLNPGQLLGIIDMIFGPDGTMYVSSDQIGGGQINVFRPF
ncbi:hypothetical protein BH11ARM1_BH11ARM1_07790 [soil metagenome]